MDLGREREPVWQIFLAASIRLFNDGKWIREKAYQYTNAESNIETGASCQNALGCVLLEQSSQALRGLLKEESEIEVDTLAVGRHRVSLGNAGSSRATYFFHFVSGLLISVLEFLSYIHLLFDCKWAGVEW